jgi:hypothetical protein
MKQIGTMLLQLDKEVEKLTKRFQQVKVERDKYKELYEGLQKKLRDGQLGTRINTRSVIGRTEIEAYFPDFKEEQ